MPIRDIHTRIAMYFIDPEVCNECGVCVTICPTNAIKKGGNPFSPYVWGMLSAYVECVLKGAKPVAHLIINYNQTGYLTRHLAKLGLRVFYRRADKRIHAFIYKKQELFPLIKQIDFTSRNPRDHALYGVLFGYDSDAIREYVARAIRAQRFAS